MGRDAPALMDGDIYAEQMPAALRRMGQAAADYPIDQVLVGVAAGLRDEFALNFARKVNADGSAWPERKDPGDGHPLLIDEGALLMAAASPHAPGHIEEIRDGVLEIGVDASVIKYARAHQEGHEENNLPQRQYLYVTEETLDDIEGALADSFAWALEV